MNNTNTDSARPLIARIETHFDGESPQQVVNRSQELLSFPNQPAPDSGVLAFPEAMAKESALAHPSSLYLPLTAYLASALSNLSSEERARIDELSEFADSACRAVDISLYQPGKHTDPLKHAAISSEEVFKIDREKVLSSDILIHLCHLPSTGAGEELAFAYDALIPIVLIAPDSKTVSRMITGIPSLKIEIRYQQARDVCELLQEQLCELRPYLEQRRLNMSGCSQNIVGAKVRELRIEENLTKEELASRVGLTVEGLTTIEENIDIVSNPSLTVLRSLATELKTTVGELVNPDYADTIVSSIQAFVNESAEGAAARFSSITKRDQRAISRRYLIHLLHAIENRTAYD